MTTDDRQWSSGFLKVNPGDIDRLAVARYAEDPLRSPWLVFDVWSTEEWEPAGTWEGWVYIRADIATKRLEALVDFSREAPDAQIVAASVAFDDIEEETGDLLLEALYGWPEPLLEVARRVLANGLVISEADEDFLTDPRIAAGVQKWHRLNGAHLGPSAG